MGEQRMECVAWIQAPFEEKSRTDDQRHLLDKCPDGLVPSQRITLQKKGFVGKVSRVGVEPTTRRLKVCCSTS